MLVLFNNRNAEVLQVTDSEIVLRTPTGGISGGPVDVIVATATGYTVAEGAYVYDVADYSSSDDDFYAGQRAYIQVTNMYESCYGGVVRLDYRRHFHRAGGYRGQAARFAIPVYIRRGRAG